MKKLLLLLCMVYFSMHGQTPFIENFDGPCTNSSSYLFPLLNNSNSPPNGADNFCIPNWLEISGSADLVSDQTPSYSDRHLKGQVYNSENRPDVIDPSQKYSGAETYALNYDFQAGVTYKIKFMAKKSGHVDAAILLLTSNMSSQPVNFTPSYYSVPTIQANSHLIKDFTEDISHSQWNLIEIEVTSLATYNQLWFRFENEAADLEEIPAGIRSGNVFIDEFILEEVEDTSNNTFEAVLELGSCPDADDYGSVYIYGVPNNTIFNVETPVGSTATVDDSNNSLVVFNASPGDYIINILYPNGEVQEVVYPVVSSCCYIDNPERKENPIQEFDSYENDEVILFPNPAKNEFTIRRNTSEGTTMEVWIYSIDGKVVKKYQQKKYSKGLIEEQFNIRDASFQQGIYLVKITTNFDVTTKRLLIE